MADFYSAKSFCPYTFAPINFLPCDGRLLPIDENTSLFNLIGTTFGGDGVTTIGLPDLRSRVPIHVGHGLGLSTYVMGQKSGTETIALTTPQMPSHTQRWTRPSFFGRALPVFGRRFAYAGGARHGPRGDGRHLALQLKAHDSDSGAVVLNGTASINPTPAAFGAQQRATRPRADVRICVAARQFPVPQ